MSDNLGYCLSLLGENDIKIQQSALKILCELCDNILKYPEEHKYRKIRIANPSITDKLLPASGAIECLFELGFIEVIYLLLHIHFYFTITNIYLNLEFFMPMEI